jgi:hypothetical protein
MLKSYKQFISELNSSSSNFVLVKGPGHQPPGFKDYIRSEAEIKENLKYHSLLPYTIYNIAKLYADYNIAVDDDKPYEFPVSELIKYLEFDRKPGSAQEKYRDNGKHYNELKEKIKKDKTINPIWITMDRQSNGDVQVFIGEGNHRTAIAQDLGIKTIKTYIKAI